MGELAGTAVPMADLLGRRGGELAERLEAMPGWKARFDLLDQVLMDWLDVRHAPDERVMRAWWRLQGEPITVGQLAGELGGNRRSQVESTTVGRLPWESGGSRRSQEEPTTVERSAGELGGSQRSQGEPTTVGRLPGESGGGRRLQGEPITVGRLAGELGVSRRWLEVGFRREVGLTPKTVARVARFQRAVRVLSLPSGSVEQAVACGYADQPHLTREMRELSGFTPRRLCAFVQDIGRGAG